MFDTKVHGTTSVTGPGDPTALGLERNGIAILMPAEQTVPIVFASPHSGQDYPSDLLGSSMLTRDVLRRSEDAFIDQLYAAAPQLGAPLLKAHFPRVYVDPNREPFELDPAMFDGNLPDYVNRDSPRVAAGLGTIARVVASGEEIYHQKLDFEDAKARIERHYFPYHRALKSLLDLTFERFGTYLLIDCHSMPSIGGPMDSDPGLRRVGVVLGDCFGSSCNPAVTKLAESTMTKLGYSIRRNIPYAGGFTTRHYGSPRSGRHTLQIEVNRALYMDERAITPTAGFGALEENITKMIETFAHIDPESLRPR